MKRLVIIVEIKIAMDCVNHDKWEELTVEEIRTDNTETLKNALKRIAELEQEKSELLGLIQAKDKVIKDLEEENAELRKEATAKEKYEKRINVLTQNRDELLSEIEKLEDRIGELEECY